MSRVVNLFLLLSFVSVSLANNWATYPQVPKTASINGFADPIYDLLPQCAKKCVEFSTGNTPCPYWDTGCFCVMPQWSGLVAQCVAENCAGQDVVVATSLATSLCSKVGANTWMMPASLSTALATAAGNAKDAVATGDSDSSASATSSLESSVSETGSASETQENAKTTGSSSKTDASSAASTSTSTSTSSTTSNNGSFLLYPGIVSAFLGFLFTMFI
ncbi:putative hyphal surface antigen precursor [Scheffersomyces xylosifermentans]|uniref:putative hyphal surface antigen precursor n=1 Tax=Scheffersomyces xylosifermentans TaxID=1304137 RepID=UPI00315D2FBA